MQELVGYCRFCGKPVYCRDGFLDGVVLEDRSMMCFPCSEYKASEPDSNGTDANAE